MAAIKTQRNASKRRPSLRGIVMQDITQGVERARSWPAPRGKPKTKAERERLEKFANVQRASRYMAPEIYADIINAVKGTPLLPRDIFTSIVYGRFCEFILPDGKVLKPMSTRKGVSDSLDAITQVPGSTLRRGETMWEAVPPGGAGGGGGSTQDTARYWRLRGIRGGNNLNPDDGLGFCLVQWRNHAGAGLAPSSGAGAFANVTDTGGTWSPAEAFNGSSASGNGWYSGNNNAGHVYHGPYLGYDFGEAVQVATVEFAPLTGFAWTVGKIVAVDFSADGVVWQQRCLIDCRTGADATVEVYELP